MTSCVCVTPKLHKDGSLLLPLLSGMALTFVVQSTAPVIVAGIGMATAGLLAVDQVLVLYCGACLGSSLILYLLTMAVTGRARQVAMYQVLFNCVLSAIFVPLICLEAYGKVPLIAAALGASGLPLAQSLGLCVICFEVATAAVRLAGLDLAVRLIQRWWPPTEVEALARPQFIHDHALDDVEGGSLLLPLLAGMVLTFVMQSGTPLIMSGICMAAAGLLGIDQVLMLYCGTCLSGIEPDPVRADGHRQGSRPPDVHVPGALQFLAQHDFRAGHMP